MNPTLQLLVAMVGGAVFAFVFGRISKRRRSTDLGVLLLAFVLIMTVCGLVIEWLRGIA